jgi:hypothetical protein
MIIHILLKLSILSLFLFPYLISPAMAAEHIEFKLGWDANLENDLDGYEIYFRNEYDSDYRWIGEVYVDELIKPSEPMVTITDLYNGVLADQITPAFKVAQFDDSSIYYFALKAFDKDGNISDFSEELCVEVSGSSALECHTAENDGYQTAADTSSGGGGGGGGGGCLITTVAYEFHRDSGIFGILILLGILVFGVARSKKSKIKP